jgi:hypothetical protein
MPMNARGSAKAAKAAICFLQQPEQYGIQLERHRNHHDDPIARREALRG